MSDPGHLDGNLLAGPLGDLFAVDLTIATTTCSGCGKVDRVAALHVYVVGEGYVARCPGCGDPSCASCAPRPRWSSTCAARSASASRSRTRPPDADGGVPAPTRTKAPA